MSGSSPEGLVFVTDTAGVVPVPTETRERIDFSDMSSTQFRAEVMLSPEPAAYLALLHEELQGRYYQAEWIVATAEDKPRAHFILEEITELLGAPDRADLRSMQKREVVAGLLHEHPGHLLKAEDQIAEERDQESSFRRFRRQLSPDRTTMLNLFGDQRGAPIMDGDVRWYSGNMRLSDRDQYEEALGNAQASLEGMGTGRFSGKKNQRLLNNAIIHTYNAFVRLKHLEEDISNQPEASRLLAQFKDTLAYYRSLLARNVSVLGDLSPELRSIVDSALNPKKGSVITRVALGEHIIKLLNTRDEH